MKLITLFVLSSISLFCQVQRADPPAAKQSGMPYLALAPDGTVYLSWIDPVDSGSHALRYSRWSGTAWNPASTIAAGKNWFVNWADFPSLLILPDGSMMAHWLTRANGKSEGYGFRVARRGREPGAAWLEVAHQDPAGPEDEVGFVTLTPAGAAYLSPRPQSHDAPAHHSHEDAHGEQTLRFLSFRDNGTVDTGAELDPDVCSCCQTTAALTSKGLLVAYRDHQPGEIRDIAVVRQVNGAWTKPKTLHADGWKINGCPTDGPSMAASGQNAAIAWMTRANEKPKLQIAVSRDSGATFLPPIRVDDGNPLGRPSLTTLGAAGYLLAWIEKGSSEKNAEVRLRRVNSAGRAFRSIAVAPVAATRSAGLPKVSVFRDQVLVAWRDNQVRAGWIKANSLPQEEKR